MLSGLPRISQTKFFLTRHPLPVSNQSGRTRLWAPSLPRLDCRACNSLLDFPGEQPTLGASKMVVYCLRRYSLNNLGRILGVFRLLANYIQNE
jgi:hypothetical protein